MIALSTMEAKYVETAMAAQEAQKSTQLLGSSSTCIHACSRTIRTAHRCHGNDRLFQVTYQDEAHKD